MKTSFAQKKRSRTPLRRPARPITCGICLMLLLTLPLGLRAGYGWMMHTDFFRIATIRYHGCRPELSSTLEKISGPVIGIHILNVDITRLSKQLEDNPWVYKAIVTRRLPGSVNITIEERIPAAVIQLDRSYLVDTHGDIFLQADASYGHYPVLTGVAKKDLIHNSAPSARLIKKALTLLDTIRQQRWCAQKDLSVHIDKTFGLTLTLAPHNTKIFLGHDHFADKLPGATKILEDLAQKGALAKTININAINKAYVTLQPGYGV